MISVDGCYFNRSDMFGFPGWNVYDGSERQHGCLDWGCVDVREEKEGEVDGCGMRSICLFFLVRVKCVWRGGISIGL